MPSITASPSAASARPTRCGVTRRRFRLSRPSRATLRSIPTAWTLSRNARPGAEPSSMPASCGCPAPRSTRAVFGRRLLIGAHYHSLRPQFAVIEAERVRRDRRPAVQRSAKSGNPVKLGGVQRPSRRYTRNRRKGAVRERHEWSAGRGW